MSNVEMFDMHNHILFGVDDGAKTLQDSLDLIKVAYDDGIRGLVLTPHFHPKRGMAHYAGVVENFNNLFDILFLPAKKIFGKERNKYVKR